MQVALHLCIPSAESVPGRLHNYGLHRLDAFSHPADEFCCQLARIMEQFATRPPRQQSVKGLFHCAENRN